MSSRWDQDLQTARFFNQPIETKVENYIATETGPSARTPDEIQLDKFLTVQALFVTSFNC